MFRLMSTKYCFNSNHINDQRIQYKVISINGISDTKNILNTIALGANAFISLSFMNQSIDTKASDDTPIISAEENSSLKDCG